jgi:hypothetical protein
MVERAGITAGLDIKCHPHMLRHACGCALANKDHDTRALPITHASKSAFLARIPKILARDHKTMLRKIPGRLGMCVGARKSF